MRSKYQPGSAGFDGTNDAVTRCGSGSRRAPSSPSRSWGTNPRPVVQKHLHGHRLSGCRDCALEDDWIRLVVLDVIAGLLVDGNRDRAIHSSERQREASGARPGTHQPWFSAATSIA